MSLDGFQIEAAIKKMAIVIATAILVAPQLEILDNESISASNKEMISRRNSIRIENAKRLTAELF